MYDELVKRLRELPHLLFVQLHGHEDMVYEAADAIEELTASVECYEATTDMALIEEDGSTVIRFMPKWIPVTEKPPKAYEDVLLLFPHNQARLFLHDDRRRCNICCNPLRHHGKKLPAQVHR